MNVIFLPQGDWLGLSFRLLLAMLVGAVIGLNRQRGGRPAGMRTFTLVAMGSALFVMVPIQAEGDSSFAAINALSRTVQGVAAGVGFLGAGLILQRAPKTKRSGRPRVSGLTTAATIWITAALGAVIGCGLWQLGLIGAFFTLLTLSGFKRLQRIAWLRQSWERLIAWDVKALPADTEEEDDD